MTTVQPHEVEVADRATVLDAVAKASRVWALPVPDTIQIPRDHDQVTLSFYRSADLDAWADYLNGWFETPQFAVRSDIRDTFWHYSAQGYWLGRLTTLYTVHSYPVGDELVQPAVSR